MSRTLRIILISLGVVIAAVIVGGLAWALTPLGPGPTALKTLDGTEKVAVTKVDGRYEFAPHGEEPTSAVVFYPGGRVDARSYAPVAERIAARGHLVVVPVMPLSLAVLNPNAADDVIAAHPEVESWVIGGHSLGGAMAAQYAAKNASKLSGIIYFAAYAPEGADLSKTKLSATDVTATNDTVLDAEAHADGEKRLPPDVVLDWIEGGNHAQFGDYGEQPGDSPATISGEQQWDRASMAAEELLERIDERRGRGSL
jgi:pimeloyl-ACP methyl ester carboxylesterase